MGYNKSLDFLNMIKNGEKAPDNNVFHKAEQLSKTAATSAEPKSIKLLQESIQSASAFFAVIDTETNWHDEVMSLGVAIADRTTFKCLETRYYIFEQEARVGGMYSSVLYKCRNSTAELSGGVTVNTRRGAGVAETGNIMADPITDSRKRAMADLADFLASRQMTDIYAYNAKFDFGHLPELSDLKWYDIMRIAAYKQFNKFIPDTAPCCKTGRLKSDYGVEPITRMLTGHNRYYEVHNAVADAVDELRIIELLELPLSTYDIARIGS